MITFNPETDSRCQPAETYGVLDCGCVLFYDDQDCACLRMCKLHRKAEKMLEACQAMRKFLVTLRPPTRADSENLIAMSRIVEDAFPKKKEATNE